MIKKKAIMVVVLMLVMLVAAQIGNVDSKPRKTVPARKDDTADRKNGL